MILSGPISTSLPGKKGDVGKRARITYISTYADGMLTDDYLLSQIKYENEAVTESITLSYSQADIDGVIDCDPYQTTTSTIPQDSSTEDKSNENMKYHGDIIKWADDVWFDKTDEHGSTLHDDHSIYPNYKFFERTSDTIDSSIGYIAKLKNSFMQVICDDLETPNPKITKRLEVEPEPYDYILFVDINSTFLLIIESVEYKKYYEPTVCYCKVIDSWTKPSDEAKQINDISDITDTIGIYCSHYDYSYRMLSNEQYSSKSTTPAIETVHDSDVLRNFIIISQQGKTIGNYKIELEFISDYNTPEIFSSILNKFDSSTSLNYFFGDPLKYQRTDTRKYNYIGEDVIFSGASFDDEKLDTFYITIKNFEDGVNELTYTPSVNIPIKLLKACHEHYHVNLYIHYKKLNGAINKVLITSMSAEQFIEWNDSNNILNNK